MWSWKQDRSSSSSIYTGGSCEVMKVEGLKRCLLRGCCRLLVEDYVRKQMSYWNDEISLTEPNMHTPYWLQEFNAGSTELLQPTYTENHSIKWSESD